MSGGIFAQLGTWFEGDYVCLQWLRMLAGRADEVTWQPAGADVVDVRIREGARRIAVQCKTRAAGRWTPDELAPIVERGMSYLTRHGCDDEFRFVHDGCAAFPPWLAPWAGRDGLAACVPEKPRDRETSFGRLLSSTPREVLARCYQSPLTRRDLQQQLDDLAYTLVTDPRRLLEALRALRDRDLLGRSADATALRSRIDASRFEWRSFTPGSLAEVARVECTCFVDSYLPPTLERLPRPEIQALMSLLRHGAQGRTVIVHGAPGIGKSVVLAEAVALCAAEGAQVLAFRADDLDGVSDRELVPERLAAVWSDERPRIIFIDQLDQVASVLGGAAVAWRNVRGYVRAAMARRMTLVLGVRTVDVHHDSLLRHLVSMGSMATPPDTVTAGREGSADNAISRQLDWLSVEPLTEPVAAKRLESLQIAYFDLPQKTRELVRNPLALKLFENVVETAGWRAARSVHDLVEAWLSKVLTPIDGGRDALDAVMDAIAARRTTRVERIHLERLDFTFQALVSAGVLIDEQGGLRPLHQVFLDAHVAKKLGSIVGVDEVVERMGSPEGQGVLQATQLRYAVSRWVGRAPRLLDELYRTPHLRPLSRFALLLGLADESDAPTPELGQFIAGWLRDGLHTDWIMKVVLHGRGPWVHAVRDWIVTAWRPDENADERQLVELLASVAVTAGDLVADVLTSWAEVDPDVLRRARVLFFQSPTADTDRLFELRTSDPVLFAELHPYVDWPALVASHPARAARCFALLMSSRASEAWFGGKDAAEGRRPKLADLKRISKALPGRLWREMSETWRSLEPGDLNTVQVGYDESGRSLIAVVIEALGQDLALLLDRGVLGWDELVASLPHPLRTLDTWLLVAVASAVEAEAVAHRAWLWIDAQRAPREVWIGELDRFELLRELSIDGLDRFTTQVLARSVAEHLSVRTSPELRGPIEAWCAELGEDPCSTAMTANLEPLNSGFGAGELRGWSPEEWVRALRAAPARGRGQWEQTGEGFTSRDIHYLALGLYELVGDDPRASVGLAVTILDADPPVDERVLPYLVAGICRGTPEPRLARADDWLPLSDDQVEQVIAHPRVLASERCGFDLARIVSARAHHPWLKRVMTRIIALALEQTEIEMRRFAPALVRAQDLSSALYQAPSAVALEAIAALSQNQAAYRERALHVAIALCGIGPNHRRLAAVRLAATLIVHFDQPAAEAVLAGCEELAVAAHHDGLRALLYTVDRLAGAPAIRTGVLRLMEHLCVSEVDELRHAGGRCAAALRWRGLVTDEQLVRLRTVDSSVGLGMTEVLSTAIPRGQAEPWMFELVLALADDTDAHVVRAAVDAMTRRDGDPIELPEGWLERLAMTRAALLASDDIIELGALYGAPSTVAGLVLKCAHRLVDGLSAAAPTHWNLALRMDVETLCSHLAQLLEAESREAGSRSAVAREALTLWERLLESVPPLTVGRTRTFVG